MNTTEISPYTRTHTRDLLWGAKATLEWEQERETGTEAYRNREPEKKGETEQAAMVGTIAHTHGDHTGLVVTVEM